MSAFSSVEVLSHILSSGAVWLCSRRDQVDGVLSLLADRSGFVLNG